jgi:uncharacterized membrane protein
MNRLIKYFIKGLLFLIPVAVTVYVIIWVFQAIDGGMQQLMGADDAGDWWVKGLGVVILLVGITVVGFLTSLFITRPLVRLIEKLFSRLPLVKLLYTSIKDLIDAFVGEKKKFDQPVIVNLMPGGNTKALGFITRKSMEFLGLADSVAVYFPQSYNFAGSVVIVSRDQVQPIELDSSDVMAFIVSGGVSGISSSEKKG